MKKSRNKIIGVTFACGYLVFGACFAFAQEDICSAVLRYQAFNTHESTTQSRFNESVRDSLCETEWKSEQDFSQRARSAGLKYKSLKEAFGASYKDERATGSASENYRHFCEQNDRDMYSSFFSQSRSQVADSAVNAWEKCVNKREGLFAASSVSLDHEYVTVRFNYISDLSSRPKLILRGVEGNPLKCTLGGRPIANLDVEAAGIKPTNRLLKFAITCKKAANKGVAFSINTSETLVGEFRVPGKTEAEESDIRAELRLLNQKVDNFRTTLTTSLRDIEYVAGKPASCDVGWDKAISIATCPEDKIRVGGTCEFTCFNLEHTYSGVEGAGENGWTCRAIASDNNLPAGSARPVREFVARAACLTPNW